MGRLLHYREKSHMYTHLFIFIHYTARFVACTCVSYVLVHVHVARKCDEMLLSGMTEFDLLVRWNFGTTALLELW